MKKIFCILSSVVLIGATSQAAPIDLSSWTALTLDFPGGQTAGNWDLSAGNTTVTQTINADPSMFLNNLNQTAFSIDGSWQVNTASDNDYMGFVFGYQNSSNFYLFDWKKASQNFYGGVGTEGMSIKQYTGATGNGLNDLSLGEFWENTSDMGSMEVLATNHGGSKGWANNTLYDFHLGFNDTNANEFTIVVKDGATTLWDVTVSDSTFTGGQFGFYNFSQETVEYSGFEQTGGTSVPSGGSTALMLGLGLLGFGAAKRKLGSK